MLRLLEYVKQEGDVVSIQWADVLKAHVGKNAARHEHGTHAVLDLFRRAAYTFADVRDTFEEALDVLFCAMIARSDAKA